MDDQKERLNNNFNDNCVNKLTFYEEIRAVTYAKRIRKKYENISLLKPYKCQFCRLWHLTKKQADKYWEKKNDG